MPNIILYCSEEDANMLLPHAETIAMALKNATAVALNLRGPEEVSFKFVSTAYAVARFQITCSAELLEDNGWKQSLTLAWAGLASMFSEDWRIAHAFKDVVEICTYGPLGYPGVKRSRR